MINLKNRCGGILAGLVLGVMLVFASMTFSGRAFADEAPKTALTLSPMSQKIILTPGETYEGTIKVINNNSSTGMMTYDAKIGSYNPVRGDGKDDYTSSDTTTQSNYNIMMDWTTLDKTTGTLQPNETAIVTYKIQVPKDAPAGAQYISILVADVTSDNDSKKEGVSIDSKVQMGSIIFANVAGETVEKGAITANNMPTVIANGKLEATSMVKNEGNIYTDASYILQVWPMFSDEEICTNEEKVETSMILPNTERYHVQTCILPSVGIYKAKQTVSIFGEESILEKTIIACPVWLMIVILAIIVAIIVAIVIIVKKHKKTVDTE